jgi:hypothetical protein
MPPKVEAWGQHELPDEDIPFELPLDDETDFQLSCEFSLPDPNFGTSWGRDELAYLQNEAQQDYQVYPEVGLAHSFQTGLDTIDPQLLILQPCSESSEHTIESFVSDPPSLDNAEDGSPGLVHSLLSNGVHATQ